MVCFCTFYLNYFGDKIYMRLVMVGTGPFAVPTFRGLIEAGHDIEALITSPMRGRRRDKKTATTEIRDLANEHGITIYDPETINDPETVSLLASFKAHILVVCDYGQILSNEALATASLGGINLHGSLLPKYRGAAPINWALFNGDTETGVTVIHMTPKVDAGPCIAQVPVNIEPEEDAVELEERLSLIGEWLIRQSIQSIEQGRLEALPQDPTLACGARRLKKTDGIVDWTRTATQIKNQVRAMEPWPKTSTHWHKTDPTGSEPLRLILGSVSVEESPETDSKIQPGTVVEVSGDRLAIQTGHGLLVPSSIQPVGKRMIEIGPFLRGYPVQPGDLFGEI
jgi:methionyl-tRNA formyltransferase